MNWYKKAQKNIELSQWVYHNTKSEFLEQIKKEGLVQGSFSNKPIDMGGDIWLAIDKKILPTKTQEHQYGSVTAIEPAWNNFIIEPDKLYLANKRGKILGRL